MKNSDFQHKRKRYNQKIKWKVVMLNLNWKYQDGVTTFKTGPLKDLGVMTHGSNKNTGQPRSFVNTIPSRKWEPGRNSSFQIGDRKSTRGVSLLCWKARQQLKIKAETGVVKFT